MKNFALIVEPNFGEIHIGIKNVIRHHWLDLMGLHHNVELVTYRAGKFYKAHIMGGVFELFRQGRKTGNTPVPTWSSAFPDLPEEPLTRRATGPVFPLWDFENPVDLGQFSHTVVTNPWMVADVNFPKKGKYSIGLIHDLVPNKLAKFELSFHEFVGPFRFAQEHDEGFQLFLNDVDQVVALSEATKADFLDFYPEIQDKSVSVVIPFNPSGKSASPSSFESVPRITILNSLDPRKNFGSIKETLLSTDEMGQVEVVVIGSARMAHSKTVEFLESVSHVAKKVSWYARPSDSHLNDLLAQSSLLFFPSFYEGLGLPVLEAQSLGIPALTSNTPALSEINLNPNLICEPTDINCFSEKISKHIREDLSVLKGQELISKQIKFLQNRTSLDLLTE